MDRQIVNPLQVPLETDFLLTNKNVMSALGWSLQGFLGALTYIDALGVIPTTVPSLAVTVNPGAIYSVQATDGSAYSSLASDATSIVKQGLYPVAANLSITPPGTVGYSQNFLVQVGFAETDGGAVVRSYFNASNPAVAYQGPANNGLSDFTVRQARAVVQIKAGTAATSGTQTTPTPDAGYQPWYVVTVAQGATTITAGNIVQHSLAPTIPVKLPLVPAGVQNSSWIYAGAAGGTSTALTASISPVPSALVAGMCVIIKTASASTAAATLNLNGLGAKTIIFSADAAAVAANSWATGSIIKLTYDGTSWQCITYPAATSARAKYASFTGTITSVANTSVSCSNFTSSGNVPNSTLSASGVTIGSGDQGIYQLSAGLQPSVNGSLVGVIILINGVGRFNNYDTSTGASTVSISTSGMASLVAGDVVTLQGVLSASGSTMNCSLALARFGGA